jgi:hypothetical protein
MSIAQHRITTMKGDMIMWCSGNLGSNDYFTSAFGMHLSPFGDF